MIEKNKSRIIEKHTNTLEGDIIKEIFKNANTIAFLHQTISSPRGDYFRRKLLQILGTEVSVSDIEKMRSETGLRESQRHINKLLDLQFIELSKEGNYTIKYIQREMRQSSRFYVKSNSSKN